MKVIILMISVMNLAGHVDDNNWLFNRGYSPVDTIVCINTTCVLAGNHAFLNSLVGCH